MEEQKKIMKKGIIFWIIFDVILFGVYFLCLLIRYNPNGMVSFYDGFNNTSYTFSFLFPPFFGITMVCIVTLLIRLFYWNRYFKSKRNLWLARVAAIIMLLLYSPIIALMFPNRPPGYLPFTKGFHHRMEERLDVSELQEWLKALNESDFDKSYFHKFDVSSFPLSMPDTAENLKMGMSYIEFMQSSQGDVCLRLEWGGPPARWGVVIGPKEMSIPPTEDVRYDEDGFRHIGEYRLKLEDGAYVWHDLR